MQCAACAPNGPNHLGFCVLQAGVDRRHRQALPRQLCHSVCPPELKFSAPAHAKQLGWCLEFELRVTQGHRLSERRFHQPADCLLADRHACGLAGCDLRVQNSMSATSWCVMKTPKHTHDITARTSQHHWFRSSAPPRAPRTASQLGTTPSASVSPQLVICTRNFALYVTEIPVRLFHVFDIASMTVEEEAYDGRMMAVIHINDGPLACYVHTGSHSIATVTAMREEQGRELMSKMTSAVPTLLLRSDSSQFRTQFRRDFVSYTSEHAWLSNI